jgi:hypothetical protein
MPIVIAPDVIHDLIAARGERGQEAAMLFDAIAADVEAGTNRLPAYIAPVTVPLIHYVGWQGADWSETLGITTDLLRLLLVVPLVNEDYVEASLRFRQFAYEDALQFVTYRRVGARYLVTNDDFGGQRAPVRRRTAGEVAAVVGRG